MSVNFQVKLKHLGHGEIFAKRLRGLIDREYGTKRGSRKNFYDDFSIVLKANDIENNGIDETGKKWVTGQTIPSTEKLELLAGFFNVSIDYLLGKTDIESSIDEDFIKDYTGLEPDAIRQLHNWMDKKEIYHTQKNQSLAALNMILSYRYNQVNNDKDGWGSDVLHFIGNYLMSENAVRDIGYAGFETDIGKSITVPLPLEAGDVVIKNNGIDKLEVKSPVVCSNFTTDDKKIGLYENKNPGNKYIDSISELFKTASLNRIGKVLDNIIKNKPKKNAGV